MVQPTAERHWAFHMRNREKRIMNMRIYNHNNRARNNELHKLKRRTDPIFAENERKRARERMRESRRLKKMKLIENNINVSSRTE
jgi:hypothetical protein